MYYRVTFEKIAVKSWEIKTDLFSLNLHADDFSMELSKLI